MKLISVLLGVAVLGSSASPARADSPSPVTLTIAANAGGAPIPENFTGLSFGMKALLPNKDGAHLFSPANTPLVTLFQNLGLRHLRLGGTSVESPPATLIPGQTEIDNLFAFARAAGVNKIIYSFRLLETNVACNYAATNAALARYIWNHYRAQLESFSIGNEPDVGRVFRQDVTISNFPSYLDKWRRFAAAITNAVPEAKFAGPDAGSANIKWTTEFAQAEEAGLIESVTEHFYAGGKGKDVPAAKAIDDMLSPKWLKNNQRLYDKMAAPVLSRGLSCRFTEANDHYSGGVPDASDTFAGALWALDFLHWWAAHQAQGVDFHNTQWVASDIIRPDAEGHPAATPKGYGVKAFDLGCHGAPQAATLSNPDDVNLTAYAVRGVSDLFATFINKEHGESARAAEVTIDAAGTGEKAEVIFLIGPKGIASKTGITLGGEPITASNPWQGKWSHVKSNKAGEYVVKVAAGSAAIVKISTK